MRKYKYASILVNLQNKNNLITNRELDLIFFSKRF
jgi:hypothetical protein